MAEPLSPWSGPGVLLTGGRSRRMGRTKALVEVDGVPMGERVAMAMAGAGCTELIALGGDPDELAPLGLAVLADPDPGAGPLPAVVAALSWAGTHRDVMILACDLAFVTAADLGVLTAAATAHPDVDVVVARSDRREPACAVWRTSARERLEALVMSGERALHRALDVLTTVEVALDARALRNINSPADLGDYPGFHER